MVKINENTQTKILDLISKFLKYGFSTILAIAGVVVCLLGLYNYTIMPESLWAGLSILGFSTIYLISELILKSIKTKYDNKRYLIKIKELEEEISNIKEKKTNN